MANKLLTIWYLNVSTNMHAELAICQGLKMVVQLGDANVEFEFDLLEAINLIRNRYVSTHEFGVIIEDIEPILAIGP